MAGLNSPSHTTTITHIKKTSRIERLAFPTLGNKAINVIKSADVLAALKPLIDKGQLETAHRLHAEISAIFAYAVVHNYTESCRCLPRQSQYWKPSIR